jgi:nucleoside-diphosphate-sugar epimerase
VTKTILVTGASGNIGSEVIKQLSEANNADLTQSNVSFSSKPESFWQSDEESENRTSWYGLQ